MLQIYSNQDSAKSQTVTQIEYLVFPSLFKTSKYCNNISIKPEHAPDSVITMTFLVLGSKYEFSCFTNKDPELSYLVQGAFASLFPGPEGRTNARLYSEHLVSFCLWHLYSWLSYWVSLLYLASTVQLSGVLKTWPTKAYLGEKGTHPYAPHKPSACPHRTAFFRTHLFLENVSFFHPLLYFSWSEKPGLPLQARRCQAQRLLDTKRFQPETKRPVMAHGCCGCALSAHSPESDFWSDLDCTNPEKISVLMVTNDLNNG